MGQNRRQWGGDEWENYCLQLLSLKYGHSNLQRLRSGGLGDLGIEAYSRDGCAYQCYAPEESLTSDKRYENQRSKLTTDLTKLSKNSNQLQVLLGSQKISRYIFMVPFFDDRRIVEHAAAKTEEIRGKNLPFLCDDFFIHVVTDDDFPKERAELVAAAAIELNLDLPDVSDESLGQWTSENAGPTKAMDEKLEKIPTLSSRDKLLTMRRTLLSHYLSGEETLQRLRAEYPKTWEKINKKKVAREKFLEASNNLIDETPNRRLSRVIEEFKIELESGAKELGAQAAEPLAWHAAADWLLRCPLRFD